MSSESEKSDFTQCVWEITEYEGETTQCELESIDKKTGLCEFHKLMIKFRSSQSARTERIQQILNNDY